MEPHTPARSQGKRPRAQSTPDSRAQDVTSTSTSSDRAKKQRLPKKVRFSDPHQGHASNSQSADDAAMREAAPPKPPPNTAMYLLMHTDAIAMVRDHDNGTVGQYVDKKEAEQNFHDYVRQKMADGQEMYGPFSEWNKVSVRRSSTTRQLEALDLDSGRVLLYILEVAAQ